MGDPKDLGYGAGGNRIRRVEHDPAEVLTSISARLGREVSVVERIVSAIRSVVDDLLADGNVVVLDTLILSFGDSPTRSALVDRLSSPDPISASVLRLEHHAVAAWLGLEWEIYAPARSVTGR